MFHYKRIGDLNEKRKGSASLPILLFQKTKGENDTHLQKSFNGEVLLPFGLGACINITSDVELARSRASRKCLSPAKSLGL